MTASLTALATVVWSDLAEASVVTQEQLADEVPAPSPVKVSKIQHKEELDLSEILEQPRPMKPGKRRLNFGSFEGY
jgi:hypothetical protein